RRRFERKSCAEDGARSHLPDMFCVHTAAGPCLTALYGHVIMTAMNNTQFPEDLSGSATRDPSRSEKSSLRSTYSVQPKISLFGRWLETLAHLGDDELDRGYWEVFGNDCK
ncbi:MAG: hypothetical protein Q8M58_11830, partial [Anaerolineales bacterium]|nr:hypothetical protein [Anaerolineales bacterium]